jgi:hypothetical protein
MNDIVGIIGPNQEIEIGPNQLLRPVMLRNLACADKLWFSNMARNYFVDPVVRQALREQFDD